MTEGKSIRGVEVKTEVANITKAQKPFHLVFGQNL